MNAKRWLTRLMVLIILAGTGALLVWAFVQRREDLALEQERERPVKAASRVTIQKGENVVTLDPATQNTSGIIVAPLESSSHREEVKAYGTVVDLQGLVDLRNSFITAQVQGEKARVELVVSRKEYERLKALHEDNQNISAKALQAAEAKWRADEANMRAAEEALHMAEGTARRRWGSVLAKWVVDASPAFERLRQQHDVLLQLTLPSGTYLLSGSQTTRVQTADGTLVSAQLVSPAPHTDPRLQGMSFFYVASAPTTGLLPGMNVLASMPVGPQVVGVLIPAPAIVWWQGKAWVYIQKGPDNFVRHAVPTEHPVRDGWFVVNEFSAGDRLVVRGAQLLLSEEFRSQIQVGEVEGQK